MDKSIGTPEIVLGCTALGQDNCRQILLVAINELDAPFYWNLAHFFSIKLLYKWPYTTCCFQISP